MFTFQLVNLFRSFGCDFVDFLIGYVYFFEQFPKLGTMRKLLIMVTYQKHLHVSAIHHL